MRALRLEIKRCDEEDWAERLQACICYDSDEELTDREDEFEHEFE